jgi:protein MAK16
MNYSRALEQVDHHLAYWPKFMVHKNKQRLTRLTQLGMRMKKLAKEEERLGERLVPRLAPKVRRGEDTWERKAESAAKVERSIECVLLERLDSGAYGDQPLNVAPDVWEKVLSGLELEGNAHWTMTWTSETTTRTMMSRWSTNRILQATSVTSNTSSTLTVSWTTCRI